MEVLCAGEGSDYRWYLEATTRRTSPLNRVPQQRCLIVHRRGMPTVSRVLFSYSFFPASTTPSPDGWLVEAVEDFFSRVPPEVGYSHFAQKGATREVATFGDPLLPSEGYTPLERLFLTLTGRVMVDGLEEEDYSQAMGGFPSLWCEESPLHPERIHHLLPAVFPTAKEAYASPFGKNRVSSWSSGLLVPPPEVVEHADYLMNFGLSPLYLLFLTPEEVEAFTTVLSYLLPQKEDPFAALPPLLREDPALLLTYFPWRKPTLFTGGEGLPALGELTTDERADFLQHYFLLASAGTLTGEEQEEWLRHLLSSPRPPSPHSCWREGLAFVQQWLGEEEFKRASFDAPEDAVPALIYLFLPLLRDLLPLREEFTRDERARLLSRLFAKTSYAYLSLPASIPEVPLYSAPPGGTPPELKHALEEMGVTPFRDKYLWVLLPRLLATFGAGEVARLVLAWPRGEDPLTRAEVELLLEKSELLAYPLTWWLSTVREGEALSS